MRANYRKDQGSRLDSRKGGVGARHRNDQGSRLESRVGGVGARHRNDHQYSRRVKAIYVVACSLLPRGPCRENPGTSSSWGHCMPACPGNTVQTDTRWILSMLASHCQLENIQLN